MKPIDLSLNQTQSPQLSSSIQTSAVNSTARSESPSSVQLFNQTPPIIQTSQPDLPQTLPKSAEIFEPTQTAASHIDLHSSFQTPSPTQSPQQSDIQPTQLQPTSYLKQFFS